MHTVYAVMSTLVTAIFTVDILLLAIAMVLGVELKVLVLVSCYTNDFYIFILFSIL